MDLIANIILAVGVILLASIAWNLYLLRKAADRKEWKEDNPGLPNAGLE